jgi:hypothetical protein
MSGIRRFEPYAAPCPSIAVASEHIDQTSRTVFALTRENQKLRHEKALALAAAEAERAESARLRGENRRLANELATANALRNAERMSP